MKLIHEFRIGLRYALTGRYDRFVSFVSLLSAAGIALGVAALIVVLAVMNGFHQELRSRILSVASHLEAMTIDEKGFENWEDIGNVYLQHPDVIAVAPQIQSQALLIKGKEAIGAIVRGILPEKEVLVSKIDDYIHAGELNHLKPGSYAIIIGKKMARRLRLQVGDSFMVVIPQGRLTAAGFYPRMRKVYVAGIFSSGLYQHDSGLAYMHIEDTKKLYRLQGASSIRLQLTDLMRAPILKSELSSIHNNTHLYDWTNSHGGLFRALIMEKRVMFVILMLIIAVAAFNIVSALVTMVRNKRGDIAILRAFGATSGTISRIFLFQGMIIGIVGVFFGFICGIPIAKNAGDILYWIENHLNLSLFPASIYHLDRLPSIVSMPDSLLVAAMALLLTLLAAIYPAWQGGRMQPAEALRYE